MRILLTYLLIKIYDFISWELKFINCCNLNYNNNNNLLALEPTNVDLGCLTKIENIQFSHNKIKDLPISIGKLTELSNIDLSYNNISKFPKNYSNLYKLDQLILSNNFITSFESICKTIFLTDSNNISIIHSYMSELAKIENIQFSHNKIKDLPISIGKLTELSNMDLSYNNISKFPKKLFKFLDQLILSNNFITSFESICKLNNCKNLRKIHIDFSEMLSNLNKLDLRANAINLSLAICYYLKSGERTKTTLRIFIGTAKRVLIKTFCNPKIYKIAIHHIGLDVFCKISELIHQDNINCIMEIGIYAF
ncbi:leucine-rich repeat containing protein [Vairimorpha apis BRL 01]|uniref:Leucine-rich repeat containing protein n=1 Tax=Vairimorpha apis BRL 01 TaxID=1037528 RepID=T0LDB5_9MICR|nr:leucine-rich repeat containing protein [Vairimorpha apis BRL 01]